MENTIGGKKREQLPDFQRKVGLFEANVICINPNAEEFKEILGIELREESKATEYLGEAKDGNTYLRIAVWLKDVKNGEIFPSPATFFLEDKERENKEGTKTQYINTVGVCSWADDPNNLPDWFVEREYRVAYVGEEELYNFMRKWLVNLDYRSAETTLGIEWKKLMKGNVKELRSQIDGEWCTNDKTGKAIGIGALATVSTRERDGEFTEYQNVYNKDFFPAYSLKNFRLVDYTNPDVLAKLRTKKSKELKAHEKFVLNVTDPEHGCKDFYILKDLQDYNPDENLVASNKVISESGSDY